MGFLTMIEATVSWLFYLGIIADILFIIDLIVNCFAAYYDKKEELIVDRKVKKLYLKKLNSRKY